MGCGPLAHVRPGGVEDRAGRFRRKLPIQNVWEAFFGFDDLGRSTPFSSDGVGALVLLGRGSTRSSPVWPSTSTGAGPRITVTGPYAARFGA
jgi:hypothetical protein